VLSEIIILLVTRVVFCDKNSVAPFVTTFNKNY
jgi:hypothetical protein